MPAQDDRRRHGTRERAPGPEQGQLQMRLDRDATSAVRTSGLPRGPQNDNVRPEQNSPANPPSFKSGVAAARAPVLGQSSGTQKLQRTGRTKNTPVCRRFPEAAEGIRTLDLLHGKQNLSFRLGADIPCKCAGSRVRCHRAIPRGLPGVHGVLGTQEAPSTGPCPIRSGAAVVVAPGALPWVGREGALTQQRSPRPRGPP
jgi:hypothetical protein